jgi:hypothetical protein
MNRWRQFRLWLKRRYCRHESTLDDLIRLSPSRVQCPCLKCGAILTGEYGLDLPTTWVPSRPKRS